MHGCRVTTCVAHLTRLFSASHARGAGGNWAENTVTPKRLVAPEMNFVGAVSMLIEACEKCLFALPCEQN